MKQYKDMAKHVLAHGKERTDRTGTGTIGVFGYQFRHDLSEGFPLLTTKKMHTKSIIHELLWFLKGDTNIKYLKDNGVTIWDEWADKKGNLGPVYGKQWRNWEGVEKSTTASVGDICQIDQVSNLVNTIKATPDSRRLIVSAWNPADVPKMALPPCHALWQCQVDGDKLHLQLYQRSADLFLGVPFNIASYALLTHMIAQVTNLKPGDLIMSYGDLHIYKNHLDQVKEQISRQERPLPTLSLNPEVKDLFGFKFEDFEINGYNPHPAIKAPIAV